MKRSVPEPASQVLCTTVPLLGEGSSLSVVSTQLYPGAHNANQREGNLSREENLGQAEWLRGE